MRAAYRIEGRIDAHSPFVTNGEVAHDRDEVAGAIVDSGRAEALDHGHVGG